MWSGVVYQTRCKRVSRCSLQAPARISTVERFIQHHLSQQTNAFEVGGLWFLQNETCLVLPQHHPVDNPLLLSRSVDLRSGQRALPIAEAFASDEFRHLAVADRLHGRTGLHVPWMPKPGVQCGLGRDENLYENFIFSLKLALEEYGVWYILRFWYIFYSEVRGSCHFSAIFRPFGLRFGLGHLTEFMEDDDEDPGRREPWQLSGIAAWSTYQVCPGDN